MKFAIHIPFLLYFQMINRPEIFPIKEFASLDVSGNKNPVKIFLSPVFDFLGTSTISEGPTQPHRRVMSAIDWGKMVQCSTSTGIQKDIHLPNQMVQCR
jgi:hypothetical protein